MIKFVACTVFSTLLLSFSSVAQLPEEWLGNYKGQLEITNYKGEVSEVYMELHIETKSDSSYVFDIIYGDDSTRQERNYELIHDKENQFVMDEKNGIALPLMLFNNRMISAFKVQENTIQVSYTLEKKQLIFRTTSSAKSIQSGGRNGTPKVQGYLPFVDQYSELKRYKKK
jgi:hypothetical protein